MKVLFVSSGNSVGGISPIVKSQGDSLIQEQVNIKYYTIKGKGLKNYLKSIKNLKKYLKKEKFSIIHAHYGLSALVAFFAKKNQKMVVSFMGDDLVGSNDYEGNIESFSKLIVFVNKFFAKYFFSYNIVKSKEMLNVLNLQNSTVISNGVDFKRFYPIEKIKARKYLNENKNEKHILFCSNPDRPEKNYRLAKEAIEYLSDTNIVLKCIHGIEQEKLVYHYNSADCLILTSFHEGSPNVIKEAMACNTPIISTDVGDVKDLIRGTKGCYLIDFDLKDVADKIKSALIFNNKSDGRNKIEHLEQSIVAQKIINIYNKVLEK